MTKPARGIWLGIVSELAIALAASAAEPPTDLVRNGSFHAAAKDDLPADWTPWLPDVKEAACTIRWADEGLLMEAPERPFAVSGVWQDLKGVEGGKAYAAEALCTQEHLPSPHRSLTVRLVWMQGGKPLHPAGELVRGPMLATDAKNSCATASTEAVSQAADNHCLPDGKQWHTPELAEVSQSADLVFRDVLVAPKEADGARLALELKWPQGGSVSWRQVSVRPAPPPPPRKVKIGTVYRRPKNSMPAKNLELFCQQIDEAGRLGLDVVCLPEAITMVGTPQNAAEVARPIPGPDTERLAEAAKKNRIWVVAGLMERDGERVYNTAVLLGRDGKLVGKYRKTHLPREEWQKGITPGSDYPVFQTDFGKVAIQICYDWFFPEVDTIFGLKGAEIVFAPTWGTTFADQEGRVEGETVFRVRARDNGIYLVPSVYDGNSMVIDPLGRILVSSRGREGVFWCEVDLSRREPLWWVGHWGSITPRDRMPPTYGPLKEEPRGAGE